MIEIAAPRIHPRVLAAVAGLCMLEVLGYLLATRLVSPEGTTGKVLGDLIYPVMEAIAVVLLGLAAHHASGRRRAFYALIAVSTAFGLCGDINWAVLVLVVHRYPTPSLGDEFYICGLLLLGPVLWIGFGFGSRGQRVRALLDAMMWLVVLIYGAVSVLIVPQLRVGVLSAADKVALVETLLAVVAGIWVTGALMVGRERIPLGMKLVTLGIAAQAASWLAYSYVYTVSPIQDGSWVSTGWQATWALLILGAVAELAGDGADVSRQRVARGLSVWVTTVGVVVLLALIVVLSPGLRFDLVAVTAALVGVVIVVTRLHVSLSDGDNLAGEMQAMAETDSLTGIPNRRVFDARLSAAAEQATQSGETVGVITIDIDYFKAINDGYGHPLGDLVLQRVADRLSGAVRPSDTLARMGGEEFAVLAPGITLESIGALAERCRHAVCVQPIALGGVSIPITISLGAACMPGHAQHTEELLRVADRALYEAKANGRNVVHLGVVGSPQRSIPIPETGTVGWLEALADRQDSKQARQEHSIAMVELASRLCALTGVSVAVRRRCLSAARLHDIGKVATPHHILTSPAALTPAEMTVMRDHVRAGVEILSACPETRDIAAIVGEHHERIDGSGYPNGKRGSEISIEAQVISVADAWTAMLSDRPYRSALSIDEAREQMLRGAGTQFEASLVAALLDIVDDTYHRLHAAAA
ncbi:MAG TPA: diguanylate cyclase [Gaiellales bacterium]|nr:diguanylate cyclase [Gaiellales bacterium]